MIYLGSDHGGYKLKEAVKKELEKAGRPFEDLGAGDDKASDYPQFARAVAERISTDSNDRGILFCRSGQGMAMAANRYCGVRAAVAWNKEVAAESRKDNDSNILSLPADYITEKEAVEIVETWLRTHFSDEQRHARRITAMDA